MVAVSAWLSGELDCLIEGPILWDMLVLFGAMISGRPGCCQCAVDSSRDLKNTPEQGGCR